MRVYMYANMFRCFINVVMVGLSPRASIALPPNLHLINNSTCLSAIHKHKLTLYFSLVSSSICILNTQLTHETLHGSWYFYDGPVSDTGSQIQITIISNLRTAYNSTTNSNSLVSNNCSNNTNNPLRWNLEAPLTTSYTILPIQRPRLGCSN